MQQCGTICMKQYETVWNNMDRYETLWNKTNQYIWDYMKQEETTWNNMYYTNYMKQNETKWNNMYQYVWNDMKQDETICMKRNAQSGSVWEVLLFWIILVWPCLGAAALGGKCILTAHCAQKRSSIRLKTSQTPRINENQWLKKHSNKTHHLNTSSIRLSLSVCTYIYTHSYLNNILFRDVQSFWAPLPPAVLIDSRGGSLVPVVVIF
jgi:hypothetical protein